MRTRLIFAALLALGLCACEGRSAVHLLRLGHGLDINHPVHKGMVFLGRRLEELSGGHLRLEIYPSEQLGSERELIELLQIGSVAMTKVSTSPLESFVPQMRIFSIPYLFRNEEHLWKILTGKIGRRVLEAGQPYYLRGLCYYDAGSRSFYTKDRPVTKPADLTGLKIRVQQSLTSLRMVQALGGSATPIAWGELYTALQQGVVDGAENNPPSFYLSHHYEVCHYYSLDEHTSVPDVLLISTHVWNRLNPQEQAWLQQAADESVDVERTLWRESSRRALEEVQKAGVRVLRPDKGPFQKAVREMHEALRGGPLWPMIEEIRAVR